MPDEAPVTRMAAASRMGANDRLENVMPDREADPLLDTLVNDFGANYVFALDLLEEYRRDRGAVEPSWREYFDRLSAWPAGGRGRRPRPAVARQLRAGPPARRPPAAEPAHRRHARDAVALGPHPARRHRPAHPRRRPAHRREHGGEPRRPHRHLRAHPARAHAGGEPPDAQQAPRRDRAGKVSFTHLVAWAILRALDTFPRLNDAYAELDGQPHRIQRDTVRLGLAVDVQKKDGTRTLLVPNIKDANKLDFAGFLRGLRRPRERVRARGRSPPTTSWARPSPSPTPAPWAPPPRRRA